MAYLTETHKTELKKKIKEQMYFLDIPGMVTGLWQAGEVVFEEAFGMADVAASRQMKPGDVFHMASISKLFTASAIMKLQENKQLNIHQSVLDYLPGFRPSSTAFKDVAIKQMLCHSSGLPDCEDYEWEKARSDDKALEDFVMAQQHLSFVHQPGERFLYSNIAYEILGHIVQKVSGMSFEDYCREYIFKPAGMEQSDFLKANVPETMLVKPHVKDEHNRVINSDIFPYNRSHAPSSTLYAPMKDLFDFAQVILDTLEGKRDDVLHQKTLKVMLQEHMKIKQAESVGLGWFLSDYQGEKFIGHEGNDIGFRTTYAIVPSKQISIVVLANIQKASTRKIMRMLYDVIYSQ